LRRYIDLVQVAMAMVGHKTESIYRRYAIVSASIVSRRRFWAGFITSTGSSRQRERRDQLFLADDTAHFSGLFSGT
jgi:hypothetical protein